MCVIWIILFAAHYRGIESLKRFIYFLFPMMLVFVLTMLVGGIILGGDGSGAYAYIFGSPDFENSVWEEFQESTLWTDAAL